jgi:hypothetical protein
MLQRAFLLVHEHLEVDALFRLTEAPMVESMMAAGGDGPASDLLQPLPAMASL